MNTEQPKSVDLTEHAGQAATAREVGAPGSTDAERAAWLADKIGALGDYAKEAAAMLRRWPASGVPACLCGQPISDECKTNGCRWDREKNRG